MNEISRILIAYDGSACSDAALEDLKRAGLPGAAEAVLLTVADVIPPPADGEPPGPREPEPVAEMRRQARARVEEAVESARGLAARAAGRIEKDFPRWKVRAKVCCDCPAWAIVKIAEVEHPDLVVVGSHGRSVAGGRLVWGSVSQRVVHEAPCSVRVARCSGDPRTGPVRILIAFNGSREAEAAVAAAASRTWPPGSEACLITASEPQNHGARDAAEKLRAAGLAAGDLRCNDDPARFLTAHADAWGADSIFIGTRDLHGLQHLLHGSVSATVAARAPCSVEVVRPPRCAALFQVQRGAYAHAG